MSARCFYFGCWNDAGHYLFARGGRDVPYAERKPVETFGDDVHIDGSLAPRRTRDGKIVWFGQGATRRDRMQIDSRSGECPQGQFLLHHLDNGYTAIQWWDRTQGDTRPGCSGTVLLEGVHAADAMLAALREHFPHVLANLTKSGVALVQVEAG